MDGIVPNSFGGLKNIKILKRPLPVYPPSPGHVNVKLIMSGINFQDVMTRLGVFESPSTPFLMGSECVGKVIGVGEGVSSVKNDDLVYTLYLYALPDYGALAEEISIPENNIWKVDEKIPMHKLACSLPYVVADLLLENSNIGPNSTILIHSAGGSVGLAVKDLAKDSKIIGITSKNKIEKLEGFATLIERGTDYVAEIRKTYPGGIDLVLDPQGGEDWRGARGVSLLAPGGRYILFGSANIVAGETNSLFSWWQVEKVSPLKLYEENRSIGGFHLRQLLKQGDKIQMIGEKLIGEKLKKIWKMMADGKLNPVIDYVSSFRYITEGMSKLNERMNIRKILLHYDEPQPSPTASKSEEEKKVETQRCQRCQRCCGK